MILEVSFKQLVGSMKKNFNGLKHGFHSKLYGT